MAKIYNGLIRFSSTIKPTGPQPLDDRTVVESISDLTNIDTFTIDGASIAYRGMLVSVLEDDKVYLLKNKNEITNLNSWVAIGSNNDVNIDDDYINQLINDILANKEYVTESDISDSYYNKTEIDNKFKTIDLFSIVKSLPEGEEINPNKIYLINNGGEEGNTFTEYIYADGKWETIGNLSVDTDFTNYYTKEEVESKLNTETITLSEHIKDDENSDPIYTKGESVQEILKKLNQRIKEINAGGTGAAVNIVSGTAINITEEADSTKISVNVSKDNDNAISVSKTDGGLYVESLKARVEVLEELLKNVITVNNIGDYAVTSISYANSTKDIKISGTTGVVTLELDSITNIAYGDAEIISEN